MPRSMSPSASSMTVTPTSWKLTSVQPSPALWRAAVWSLNFSAALGSRSAIVLDPVLRSAAVPASIASSWDDVKEARFYVVPRRARRGKRALGPRALRGGALGGRGPGALTEGGQEEGLVDPALEDRDAQLHALRDDFLALEAGLACELRGRQVIGHRRH